MPAARAVPPVGAVSPLRAAAHVVLTTGVVVLGYVAATVLAYVLAGPTGSTSTFVVAHTVAASLLLLVLARWRAGAGLALGLRALPWTGVPVLVAHLLLPTTWVGRALAGRALLGPGPGGVLLDLLLWAGVTAVGLAWASSQVELRRPPETPYG